MHAHAHHQADDDQAPLARDPVCGMKVDPATSTHRAEHAGETYHFCCARCCARFQADPHGFLEERQTEVSAAASDALHICPMHLEIRQEGPGSCPICGMALEPETPTLDDGPSAEFLDMRRRLVVAAAFALPLVAIAMGRHLAPGLFAAFSSRTLGFAELLLASPVVVWAGAPFFVRGWQSIRSRNLNMFTLIAIGTGAAYGFSLVAALAPDVFPAAFRGADGSVGLYFEAAATIIALVLLGQVLEIRAREQTGGALRALLDLKPPSARRIDPDGSEADIALDQIRVGDRLRVRPGETVPLDGVVTEGRSTIDDSMLTGEAIPVEKVAGEAVTGGTRNGSGSFIMRAERVGSDTMLARIVQMVAEAQRSRAPIQSLADRVASWFVPAVLLVAIMAFIIWASVGPAPSLSYAMITAVSVLIIACPCALGLATPMSIMVGIGRGAGLGVLIRDAAVLERLSRVDTLVIDKTGTLTEGQPQVTSILPREGTSEDDLLGLAAGLELGSEHPLAEAIVGAARARHLDVRAAEDFEALTGKGVRGRIGGRTVALGNTHILDALGISTDDIETELGRRRNEGETVVAVVIDGEIAGLVAISDPVKTGAKEALQTLMTQGLEVVMLTGDNLRTAEAVARQIAIERVEAEVLPEQKQAVITRLQADGRIVAMAGDGINDAPALAAADVGIAMGTGADVAIESAGVTLIKGDLAAIARARALSVATMRNIRQNLVFAFGYNAIGVPIAAGVLYPGLGVLLSPIVAAAAMSLSSVSVIGNALRLRNRHL